MAVHEILEEKFIVINTVTGGACDYTIRWHFYDGDPKVQRQRMRLKYHDDLETAINTLKMEPQVDMDLPIGVLIAAAKVLKEKSDTDAEKFAKEVIEEFTGEKPE